jgi:diacylglycerol kinase family enzyme
LIAPVVLIAIAVAVLTEHLLPLLAVVVCLAVALSAAAYAVTRTEMRRVVATVVAVLSVAAVIALVMRFNGLRLLVGVITLLAVTAAATRYALKRDIASLRSSPTPGDAVGPARQPVLLMNPKSGGGKVERFGLVEESRRRGIDAIVLSPDDDLLRLASDAVERGADVIGMAGGDGSQALVAGVAMRHDVAFVCVPAGTRNHLAMDLGLDRDDVVGALDAFGEAMERRIDLGLMGDRVFVNNASMGLYARIVQSPEYRDRKVGTALEMLPGMLGPSATPFDLRFTGPDGTDHLSAHLVLVSNDPYQWSGEGAGSRRRIDAGTLGIVAATLQASNDASQFVASQSTGQARRPRGWIEWTDTNFEVRSDRPIEVGVDGEAVVLDSPIQFRTAPAALRVRIPHHARGYSPAAAAPTPSWSTITALLHTAAGRPVVIES